MDASQAQAYGDYSMNAASILTTVISRPTADHIITEAVEGRDSFLERRTPDWSGFPYYY